MRSTPALVLAALLSLSATDLHAGTLGWRDTFTAATFWDRPTEDLQRVTSRRVRYSSLSFFVDQSGRYEIDSNQQVFADSGFDGMIFLYAGAFDPAQPLRNAVAANDDGGRPFSSHLSVQLTAGTVYHLVTTVPTPAVSLNFFENRITGPGEIRFTACFLDDVFRFDDGTELSLLDGRFCVDVTWQDFAGRQGAGRPVEFRSSDAGSFWFFDEKNWELQVKMVDGCALNGHLWFFLAGTTNVGLTVTVRDLFGNADTKVYTNPLGQPVTPITDTTAFPCE